MNKNLYSLGLMSGTSMDGIDASIIKSDGEDFVEIIDDLYLKYDDELRTKMKKIVEQCSSKSEFQKLSKSINELEKEITLSHIEVCKLIKKKNNNIKIDLIGFHGQTIVHKPKKGYSIQIGDPKLLSKHMNTIVVSDFRKNDILNGGQGAPLAPLYHQLILKKIKSSMPLALVNIGGISNITYTNMDNKIIGFDTGPGNYLIDELIKEKKNLEFDDNGSTAKSGKVNRDFLNSLISSSYFKKKLPKSLDVKDFDFQKLKEIRLEDGLATLSMFTVDSIVIAINSFTKYPTQVLISGGGRKNKFIVENIKKKIKCPLFLIDDFGFNGDFIESQAFAYLAIRSYLKKVITLPSTTGVKEPCSGGIITEVKLQ